MARSQELTEAYMTIEEDFYNEVDYILASGWDKDYHGYMKQIDQDGYSMMFYIYAYVWAVRKANEEGQI